MNTFPRANLTHAAERADLAAAFRWTARLGMAEAVANHFSLAVSNDGTQFLINPFARAFATLRASDMLLLDANDPETLNRPGAPDPTAWGLHGSIHRRVPHARCVMHVHSVHATLLACLDDPRLPPLDQNACMFFGPRQVVDTGYGGMAFESEGERCAGMLADPRVKAMIMGNHGVLVIGRDVADAFNTLYYFERAAEVYVKALMTGRPLRVLSDAVAEKTAREWEDYPSTAPRFLAEIRAQLDAEGSDYLN
jgi:ribulose-5-phosphate 4-epimerase/fuculose-1-phosphate aldolase